MELDPLNPYVHSRAGAIHDFYGQTEQAIGAFDKAFEIDGNYLVGSILPAASIRGTSGTTSRSV